MPDAAVAGNKDLYMAQVLLSSPSKIDIVSTMFAASDLTIDCWRLTYLVRLRASSTGIIF